MKNIIEDKSFWQRHIDDLKVLGISRTEYCRRHNLNYHRFCYWLKRCETTTPKFIPVNITPTIAAAASSTLLCEVAFSHGAIKVYDASVLPLLLEQIA